MTVNRWRALLGALLGAAALIAAALAPADPALADAGARHGASWPTWQHDTYGSRSNPDEHQITPATVSGLKLKWAFTYANLPYARTGSQPAIVDGVLYVGAPDAKFYALDAKTGATKWVYDTTPVAGPADASHQNLIRDGAAVSGGRVYFGDSRGYVYALDTKTGKLDWAAKADDHPLAEMTSSPLVSDGKVYIGVSSGEAGAAANPNYPCCTFRGSVVAFDARTGKIDWKYYTLPPAQRTGSWPSGAAQYGPSGVAVWGTPVIDPASGTLYVGTGNDYTGATGASDSLLALDTRTGKPRWTYQLTGADTYTLACSGPDPVGYCPSQGQGTALDEDVSPAPNIFKVHGRTLVGVGQKGGAYTTFDARTGKVIWQTHLSPPPAPGKQDPGDAGIQWGTSYDGKAIYAATWRGNPGKLFALDPADGHVLWSTPAPADGCTTGGAGLTPSLCTPAFTPAVTTTPGLVYEGGYDGKFRIYSSRTGTQLWSFDAVQDFQGVNGLPGRGLGISGNGGAVVANGMVYVQAGYYPYYPSDRGYVLLAFGL
ncbi:PQQ-binding-like beta-propeller repeat protein [Kitasatospora viridis]|uniref:Polyvinyl alcohol dehydrogenase (Cytochrome) n=1 Tax=Kitasatospora viridis TaxID=281105 RepID=A0A561UCG7_9ACTN|nr:PQQ-binding-like beta-propeller repeat protein [Kitasatospora viridis]TWF97051.1 polyvinyl alcohol dehydrogenase (cytochrome) [Kitasatospora viridis]